jgi:small nuclear ribonucleoprotein (snRNP)-like protein
MEQFFFFSFLLASSFLWSYTIITATGKLLVLLRDGRKLLGILRSFDQFGVKCFYSHRSGLTYYNVLNDWKFNISHIAANAVLEDACERAIVGDLYCDIPLGLYIIRGENVVLIGELVWRVYSSFHIVDISILINTLVFS